MYISDNRALRTITLAAAGFFQDGTIAAQQITAGISSETVINRQEIESEVKLTRKIKNLANQDYEILTDFSEYHSQNRAVPDLKEQLLKKHDEILNYITGQITTVRYFPRLKESWESKLKIFKQETSALTLKIKNINHISGQASDTDLLSLEEILKKYYREIPFAPSGEAATGARLINITDSTVWDLKRRNNADAYEFLVKSADSDSKILIFQNGRLVARITDKKNEGKYIRENFYESGNLRSEYHSDYIGDTRVLSTCFVYGDDKSLLYIRLFKDNRLTHFDHNRTAVYSLYYDDLGNITNRLMYNKDGKSYGSYKYEKTRNLSLTENQYLDMLARELNTPLKFSAYFKIMMKYKADVSDYSQSPSFTLNTNEDGMMTGDCEDYSYLAKEILKRQGIKARVVSMPQDIIRHAECTWITKNNDGLFEAHFFGNGGLNTNGTILDEEMPLIKPAAYKTPEAAFDAALASFKVNEWGNMNVTIKNHEQIKFINFSSGTFYNETASIKEITN